MPAKTLHISHLHSGGLIPTYFCNSSCGHCLYRCSPMWPNEFIDSPTAKEIFTTIKALGCDSVHIGGGEPLLEPELLTPILDLAVECGVEIEYIETNSSWFEDLQSALELINDLKTHGVSKLLLSMSPFHNEFIPFYKVKGVIETCTEAGMGMVLWNWEFSGEINAFDKMRPHSLSEYVRLYGEDYVSTIAARGWISPGGRALDTYGRLRRGKRIPSLISECGNGCIELASTTHFHFDYRGYYIPGLCAGISIRKEDLGSPLDVKKYPIITLLFSKGVGGLLSFAMDEYGFEASKAAYFSKCELCAEIRKFLVKECGVNSHELQPAEHYLL